jgi:alkanesulfonate monooxygenase SsuD/methylene tetrahydromethanopterin reductase-like flavin-dependent oxidoreductase (luciferase family)
VETGIFLLGSVEMDDAGAIVPDPADRRYTQADFLHAQRRMLDCGVRSEELGFDVFWLTEHHFQHQGYQVIPNPLLFAAVLAERTARIKIGALFNVVPQWHPLRFAEDFALMHNLSGGRGVLGVGRGSVLLEAMSLGTVVGSWDNPDRDEADRRNREVMDEAMAVVEAALGNESFSFHGMHFDFPPAGVPGHGGPVEELTLVPRPVYPYEIWQAVSSAATLDHVPRTGYGGVFWFQHWRFVQQAWERFAEVVEEETGMPLRPGARRMLVLNVHVGDTHESALRRARPGHDEIWKFFGPRGSSRGYRRADGRPWAPGLVPTLEESVEQRVWLVGSAPEVAEGVDFYRDLLGLEHLAIVPQFPGDSYDVAQEQMARYAEEVMPLLGATSRAAVD